MRLRRLIYSLVFYVASIISGCAAGTVIVGTIGRNQVLNFANDAAFANIWTYVTQDGNNNLATQSRTPFNAINNRSQQIIFRVNNIVVAPGEPNPNLSRSVRLAVLHSVNENLVAIHLRLAINPGNDYAPAPGIGHILSGAGQLSSAAGQYFSQNNLQEITNSYVLPPYATSADGLTPFPGTSLPFYQRRDNKSANQGRFNYNYNLEHNLPDQFGAANLYHTEPKALFELIQALALAVPGHVPQNVLIISHLPMCPYCSRFLLNMLVSTPGLPNIVIISRSSFKHAPPAARPNFITNANTRNAHCENTINSIDAYFTDYYDVQGNDVNHNLLIYEMR